MGKDERAGMTQAVEEKTKKERKKVGDAKGDKKSITKKK